MSRLGALNLTKHTGSKHTATLIFFHGSGGNGENMKEWVNMLHKNFSFPHINILYPTAPVQPYTASQGFHSNVWFDRNRVAIHDKESRSSVKQIESEVKALITAENNKGISSNRIVVGGFSMGGAMALHTGYRLDRNVAGVFAFSSFLNLDSMVYEDLKSASNKKFPLLLQLHGDSDDLVPYDWGQKTFNTLKSLDVKGEFHNLIKLGHSINGQGLRIIKSWVEDRLPE